MLLRSILILLFIALSFSSQAKSPDCQDTLSLKIGIVPWTGAALNKLWSDEVNAHLLDFCIKARFSSAKNFISFINKAIAGEFDILLAPPQMALLLMEDYHYQAIAIEDWDAEILFITHQENNINTLSDLSGHTLALPDLNSAIAFSAQSIVKKSNIKVKNYQHYTNHQKVMSAVLNKSQKVGAIISPIYKSFEHIVKQRIKIIHAEEAELSGLLLAKKDLPSEQIKKIFNGLVLFDNGNQKIWQRWLEINNKHLDKLKILFKEDVETLRSRIQI